MLYLSYSIFSSIIPTLHLKHIKIKERQWVKWENLKWLKLDSYDDVLILL